MIHYVYKFVFLIMNRMKIKRRSNPMKTSAEEERMKMTIEKTLKIMMMEKKEKQHTSEST